MYCDHCQGSLVNWNEPFSVKAQCENCGMSPGDIYYTWKLYLVNPSSKAVVEGKHVTQSTEGQLEYLRRSRTLLTYWFLLVPFCSVVHISELSSLVKGASPSTPLVSNTPDATYLATNFLESQVHPVGMTSSDSIGDPTVSVPPSTAVHPHSSFILLPFAEGNQMDVGHSQWQRAMEGSSDGSSHPESPSGN